MHPRALVPLWLLYLKALLGRFGDDDLTIPVSNINSVAGLKATIVQPLAAKLYDGEKGTGPVLPIEGFVAYGHPSCF
ncbi:MAG: hypothetical protein QM738_05780 [Ferruginibacter sp.]